MTTEKAERPAPAAESVDVGQIMKWLPHRAPFLLIDKMTDIVPGVSATGIKNVTINEPYFQGHFPGYPVMPGVLIIEAMAQTGAALAVRTMGPTALNKLVYFMSLDKVRFRSPVFPGDVLELKVRTIHIRPTVWRYASSAYVGSKLCAEAEFTAMIMDRAAVQGGGHE